MYIYIHKLGKGRHAYDKLYTCYNCSDSSRAGHMSA